MALPTPSSQEGRIYKELMNSDKTVVYTGEVIVPASFLSEESKENESIENPPQKRTEYHLHG